jgi:hypothetical protein
MKLSVSFILIPISLSLSTPAIAQYDYGFSKYKVDESGKVYEEVNEEFTNYKYQTVKNCTHYYFDSFNNQICKKWEEKSIKLPFKDTRKTKRYIK